MLRIGIAGIGFMGWIHWLAYKQIAGVEVVAICDTNTQRLGGDWTGIKGNFGPPGDVVDLSNVECCSDFDQFCSLDFDLVDICLPPSLHVPLILKAAKAGKHVFSEKPLALDLEQCDLAVQACREANVILQVGHVLPFFPEYSAARKILDSGEYGTVKTAHFKRVIADPIWLNDFYDPEKIGGPLLDLHVHDAHFIRLITGQPSGVYSAGLQRDDVVSYCHSIFDFPDRELSVATSGGVINQQGRPFMHGFEIQLEHATLHFEYAAINGDDEHLPLKIMTSDDRVEIIDVGDGDPIHAFVAEINEMVKAVDSGKASPILSGELARDAIQICQAESQSVKQHRRVTIE